jgi:hypothetical protein
LKVAWVVGSPEIERNHVVVVEFSVGTKQVREVLLTQNASPMVPTIDSGLCPVRNVSLPFEYPLFVKEVLRDGHGTSLQDVCQAGIELQKEGAVREKDIEYVVGHAVPEDVQMIVMLRIPQAERIVISPVSEILLRRFVFRIVVVKLLIGGEWNTVGGERSFQVIGQCGVVTDEVTVLHVGSCVYACQRIEAIKMKNGDL